MERYSVKLFLGTCINPKYAKIAEKCGRKISYSRAKNIIKKFSLDLYHNRLTMDFYNPWEEKTCIVKYNSNKYLCIVHSSIDYIFLLKDAKDG